MTSHPRVTGHQTPGSKVWLHIGMPKTGTTAIQWLLYANREALMQHGYFYPDFGDHQHYPLVRKLAAAAGSKVGFPRRGDCGDYDRFTALLELNGPPPHTSIISSELFFQRPGAVPGCLPPPGVDPFELLGRTIDRTAEYFAGCDVTVLMWLRRQDNWLMSMYNETVKTSLFSGSFQAFADATIGVHLLKIVALWVRAFGRERVICRSYDALAGSRGSIVDSFLSTVCPGLPREALANPGGRANPGLSMEALWFKKRINEMLKRYGAQSSGPLNRRIRAVLDELTRSSADPGRSLLSQSERKDLMQRFLEDNERLVSELGYEELRALTDTSDLDVPSTSRAPVEEDSERLSLHCLDQVIKTFILGK